MGVILMAKNRTGVAGLHQLRQRRIYFTEQQDLRGTGQRVGVVKVQPFYGPDTPKPRFRRDIPQGVDIEVGGKERG